METVEGLVDRFCEAWNRHDAQSLAALWSDDGELNHPWGERGVGRDAIQRLLAAEHTGSMAESTLVVQRLSTRDASGNVAAEIEADLSAVRAPNGRRYDMQATMNALFVRTHGGWRIRTMTPLANPRRSE